MARTPSCDKSGLRKGTWTPEEDKKLIAYVTRYGSWNWRQLPRFAGLARCGKSCRLRWMNYLRPNLKRGNFTEEEEDVIIRLHTKLGNRWSAIAAELPGRTDNEIKNHWHTTLKKRSQEQNQAKNEEQQQPKSSKPNKGKETTTTTTITVPLSPISSTSSEFSSITTSASNENLLMIEDDEFPFLDGSFWTEPYLMADILSTPTSEYSQETLLLPSDDGINNGAFDQTAQDITSSSTAAAAATTQIFDACASFVDLENEFGGMLEQQQQLNIESFWTQPYVSDDVSHVPSEYFSPLCGADLWSTQNNMYDEHISLF